MNSKYPLIGDNQDRDLWAFSRDLLRFLAPSDFEHHGPRLGLELLSTETDSTSSIFHEDGYCIQDDLVLEWKLVLVTDCVISSSKIIELRNCIFLGNVEILLEDADCSPVIENCVFLKKLTVSISNGATSEETSLTLELTNSLVNDFELYNSQLSTLSFRGCVFRSAKIRNSRCTDFHATANKFESLTIVNYSADQTRFGPDQLSANPVKGLEGPVSSLPLREEHLAHIKLCARSRPSIQAETADTLEFLLSNADLRTNQKAKAHLRYLQLIDRSPHGLVRTGVWMCGGLLKPYRIVICSALFILMFGVLFRLNLTSLKNANSFTDCLYFSAIAFTTIGFGDITPTGFSRILAVLEGVAGVIFSSSLVASIIRKYAE